MSYGASHRRHTGATQAAILLTCCPCCLRCAVDLAKGMPGGQLPEKQLRAALTDEEYASRQQQLRRALAQLEVEPLELSQ